MDMESAIAAPIVGTQIEGDSRGRAVRLEAFENPLNKIKQDIQKPLTGVVSCLEVIEDGVFELLCGLDDFEQSCEAAAVVKSELREKIFRMIKVIDAAKYSGASLTELVR